MGAMRKLKRLQAHNNMKKAGYSRVNSHRWRGDGSPFSRHWREYVNR